MRFLIGSAGVAVVFLFSVVPALGRQIENWPYERLFKEAEFVVFANAEKTTDTADRFEGKERGDSLIGQETKLLVQANLKGDLQGGREIRVLHFRYPEGMLTDNGPLLVRFRKGQLQLRGIINGHATSAQLQAPEYMLFLRKRADGRYEAVSGQYDPALSIREVQMPDRMNFGLDHLDRLDRTSNKAE